MVSSLAVKPTLPEPPNATRAIEPIHRLDEDALERWMRKNVIGFRGPMLVRKFRGGQSNPTYWLGTPAAEYVLRKKPPGMLLPSAHAVDREHRVMNALRGTGVPVPGTHIYSEDPTIIGTPFFVMDHVEGRIFWNVQLPQIDTPTERRAIYDEMMRRNTNPSTQDRTDGA